MIRFVQLTRHLQLLLSVLVVAAVVAVLARWSSFLAVNFPLLYGEGPILQQAIGLLHGENPYRPAFHTPPYNVANYPPGLPSLLSVFLWFAGDISYVYGRAISMIATFGVVLIVALFVRRESGSGFWGAVSAGLFLSSEVISELAGMLRVDSLALLLGVASAYLATRHSPERRWLVFAAILTCAAGFVRQTSFILPSVTAVGWLCMSGRLGDIVRFSLYVALPALTLAAGLELWSAGGFSLNTVVANVNTHHSYRLWHTLRWVAETSPLLTGTVLMLPFVLLAAPSSQGIRIASLMVLGAVPSLLAVTKSGSGYNYLFEFIAASSVAFGVVAARLSTTPLRFVVLAAIAALQLAVQTSDVLGDRKVSTLTRPQASAEVQRAIRLASLGPVLADEYMGFEVPGGRKIFFQPYEFNELSKKKLWEERTLLKYLRRKYFRGVLIYAPKHLPRLVDERWSQRQQRLIRRYYRYRGKVLDGHLLLPREAATRPTTPERGTLLANRGTHPSSRTT